MKNTGAFPPWLPMAMAVNLVMGALLAFAITERPPSLDFFRAAPPVIQSQTPASDTVKISRVLDGDTLEVISPGEGQIRVRLSQIDAPEADQPWGASSRSQLIGLLAGKTVTLRQEGVDRYGRTLATVYANGQDVNAEMIRTGAAWAYRDYLNDPRLIDLERQARAARAGLWDSANPVRPQDWRRN